jgi:hypothetical protein
MSAFAPAIKLSAHIARSNFPWKNSSNLSVFVPARSQFLVICVITVAGEARNWPGCSSSATKLYKEQGAAAAPCWRKRSFRPRIDKQRTQHQANSLDFACRVSVCVCAGGGNCKEREGAERSARAVLFPNPTASARRD